MSQTSSNWYLSYYYGNPFLNPAAIPLCLCILALLVYVTINLVSARRRRPDILLAISWVPFLIGLVALSLSVSKGIFHLTQSAKAMPLVIRFNEGIFLVLLGATASTLAIMVACMVSCRMSGRQGKNGKAT